MAEQKNALFFFRPYGEDGYLSNFFPVTFSIDNIQFTCSEGAFMYLKCIYFDKDNRALISKIIQESNPNRIKQLGRKVRFFKEEKWNLVKYDIMVKCVREKFIQNIKIKEKLLKTYPNTLYEASKWDSIWGIGYDKENAQKTNPNNYGENLLGKALMKIRDEFIKKE